MFLTREVGLGNRKSSTKSIPRNALKLLLQVASGDDFTQDQGAEIGTLLAADLVARSGRGAITITDTGRSYLARVFPKDNSGEIDPFIRQHLALARHQIDSDAGPKHVTVDDSESPLVWLARRKGRDGRPLIETSQLQAGERLRAEFTRAQMTPRVTSNWTAAVADGRRSAPEASFTEATLAARQRVRRALDAVGPEFAGLLLDVCCFLKRLEDVERERSWPQRSGKVVLQLALDRLARHYGYSSQACGHAHAAIQTWLAPEAAFVVE
jgi:hypothetical protein